MRITSEFGSNRLTVNALSADIFAWNFVGQLAALGGTLHVERSAGRVTGLRCNTLRTRHLHFQRIDD